MEFRKQEINTREAKDILLLMMEDFTRQLCSNLRQLQVRYDRKKKRREKSFEGKKENKETINKFVHIKIILLFSQII